MSERTKPSRPHVGPRVGAVAGMLVPLPVGAVTLIILTVGENLRQYGMPWLLAITAVLMLGVFSGIHAIQASPKRRMEATGYALSSVALAVVAGFFAVIALEDLVDNVLGTGRFLSSNGAVTALGTLAGSLASLVVLPIGLCLFGIGTARARCLPGRIRWLPVAIPFIVVIGAAAGSAVSTEAVSLAWTWLVAITCFRLGISLSARSRWGRGAGRTAQRSAAPSAPPILDPVMVRS
jgi:hypothetical protein